MKSSLFLVALLASTAHALRHNPTLCRRQCIPSRAIHAIKMSDQSGDGSGSSGSSSSESALQQARPLAPLAQLGILGSAYWFHVAFHPDVCIPLLRRRISLENVLEHMQSWLGWYIPGVASRRAMRNAVPTAPGKQTLGSAPSLPWGTLRTPRVLIIQTVGTLLCAYVFSGYVSGCFEVLFYGLAALGAPLTAGMHQALQVLCGHLAWVVMALRILGTRLEAFLPAPFGRGEREDEARWLTARWRVSWLTWVLGGYFASLLAYNLIEPLNQMILPPPPPGLTPLDAGPPNGLGPGADPDGGRSVVFRLLHPEHADRLALAVGGACPCASRPRYSKSCSTAASCCPLSRDSCRCASRCPFTPCYSACTITRSLRCCRSRRSVWCGASCTCSRPISSSLCWCTGCGIAGSLSAPPSMADVFSSRSAARAGVSTLHAGARIYSRP